MIYNRFLNPSTLSLDEVDAVYDIYHAYQVTTSAKGIKYVLVIEKDGSVRQRVPYKTKRGAMVYLYDKDARVVFEADNGLHYTDSISYDARRVFHELRFADVCKNRKFLQTEQETKEQEILLSFDNLKKYGIPSVFVSRNR